MKKLLNAAEDRTFSELLRIVGDEVLRVFPKTRVADMLPIENSGIDDELYSYALKAHFDFVVATNEHEPVFAVEFDGPSHRSPRQRARDKKKNRLCERFDLPLLRVNNNHVSQRYNNRTLLAWIIEVYQLQEAFYETQAEGQVPLDEPFDPFFITTFRGGQSEAYPYWISRKARLRMQELYGAGKLRDMGSSGVIWRDDNDVMRGVEYIRITDTHGLSVTSAMRSQQFPIVLSDLLDELLTIFMMEKIEKYLEGVIELEPMQPIYDRVNDHRSFDTMLRAHSVGRAPNDRTAA